METAPAELDAFGPDERPDLTDAEREDAYRLRLHRVEKWLERARAVSAMEDRDTAFLLYWVAFNAAYAQDRRSGPEVEEFRRFFRILLGLDTGGALQDAVCRRFGDAVRKVVENVFLYERFWEEAKDRARGAEAEPDAEWNRKFRAECEEVRRAVAAPGEGDTLEVLVVLFRRLYTLRNQLVHGGATWGSRLNRYSVENGERLLASTVPVCLRVMRENPDEDWGAPPYWAGLWKGRPDTGGDQGTPPGGRDPDRSPPRAPAPPEYRGPPPQPNLLRKRKPDH